MYYSEQKAKAISPVKCVIVHFWQQLAPELDSFSTLAWGYHGIVRSFFASLKICPWPKMLLNIKWTLKKMKPLIRQLLVYYV